MGKYRVWAAVVVGVGLSAGCSDASDGAFDLNGDAGGDHDRRGAASSSSDADDSVEQSDAGDVEGPDGSTSKDAQASDSSTVADAGNDSGHVVDPTDGGSDASSAPDSGAPPSTFSVPAKLFEDGCWQDEFPNPVCKKVPKTSPPIVDWGTCTPPDGTGYGELHMATLRIPPGTCLRVHGRWEPSKAGISTCESSSCTVSDNVCKIRKNASQSDMYLRVHYKRAMCSGDFTAWWYPLEECPTFASCTNI
jgi:hypothetical protein